ncbi:hypothetical protein niasHT_006883 [Heterodera trifolii]|uniref:Gustatory receptor n=1 Tax=Heterodera trifolii TaxID=157864 RepID=A0ABD2LMJ0_9BILA
MASSSPSSSADDDSDNAEFELNIALAVLELLINLASILASLFNFFLVGRTQLIHLNMKVILVYQSACLLVRSFGRSMICIDKLAVDPANAEHFEPARTIFQLGVSNRNFLAHVLIIERVMATVCLSSYERQKSWRFSLLWSPAVFVVALFNVIMLGQSSSTPFTIVTNSSILIIGLVEFLLFVWIWHYNRRIYVKGFRDRMPSLSEKYQLSENIRIGTQQTPALICHFLCLFMNVSKLYWSYFGVPGYNYLLPITTVLGSLLGLMIEITTIQCHPFLKRHFRQIVCQFCSLFGLYRLTRSNRLSTSTGDQTTNGRFSLALHDLISGQIIPTIDHPERHFALLQMSWATVRPN